MREATRNAWDEASARPPAGLELERDGILANVDERGFRWAGARYVISRLIMTVLFGVVLFVSAGRLDWRRAWIYVGVVILGEALSAAVLIAVNPEVLNQRGTLMRPDTKRFETFLLPLYLLMGYATAVVAGFDAGRFGRRAMPFETVYFGAGLLAAGFALGTWAMAVNVYFEPTVRIQKERGHEPVTSGPYRIVRHPGYLGAIVGGLGAPLVLGSVWMFVPLALAASLFVVRAALEDRTLGRELPGYREYALRTRYRLLPGIW